MHDDLRGILRRVRQEAAETEDHATLGGPSVDELDGFEFLTWPSR